MIRNNSQNIVFILTGESMNPLFRTSDILLAERVLKDELKTGEIVVFEKGKKLIAHTVVKTERRGEAVKILTKGLNRNYNDGWTDFRNIKYRITAVKKGGGFKYLTRTEKMFVYRWSYFRKKYRNLLFKSAVGISPLIKILINAKILKLNRLQFEEQEVYLVFKRKILERKSEEKNYHPFIGKSALEENDIVKSSVPQGKKGNLVLNPDVIFRTEGDEGLVYNVKTGDFKIVNETGCAILDLTDGNSCKNAIIEKLAEKYESDDPNSMKKEINEFIDNLLKSDIIRILR